MCKFIAVGLKLPLISPNLFTSGCEGEGKQLGKHVVVPQRCFSQLEVFFLLDPHLRQRCTHTPLTDNSMLLG